MRSPSQSAEMESAGISEASRLRCNRESLSPSRNRYDINVSHFDFFAHCMKKNWHCH